jgi:hypothetical protein
MNGVATEPLSFSQAPQVIGKQMGGIICLIPADKLDRGCIAVFHSNSPSSKLNELREDKSI